MTDDRGDRTEPRRPVTREENPILWALQQYQMVIREWMHDLTAVEFTVLMQIVDRTVGWQKTDRTIGIPNMLNGGRLYSGIGNAVKRAALMKALRSLEDRGIIERHPTDYRLKHYVINLDWTPSPRPNEESDPDDFSSAHDEGIDYVDPIIEQHSQ